MGRFIRPSLAMMLALFTHPGSDRRPASPPAPLARPLEPATPPTTPGHDRTWYEPRADDFRPAYERDVALGGLQTWEQYWGWIRSFYAGNLWSRGWNDSGRWLLMDVRPDAERDRLRTRLNRLGRDICAEWAKDYTIRKIGSADLVAWGKKLAKARADDAGDGASLHRGLDEVGAHYRQKMGNHPTERSEEPQR